VSIGGADNKLTINKIDKHLNVVGFNNTITYKDGNPKVENLGSGNTINKAS
jgi:formylmethanofuran dehydrogenase subunit B